jgi:hypothetical protein
LPLWNLGVEGRKERVFTGIFNISLSQSASRRPAFFLFPRKLNPLQFAYRPNRSKDDAIAVTLHTALSHLAKRNTYAVH